MLVQVYTGLEISRRVGFLDFIKISKKSFKNISTKHWQILIPNKYYSYTTLIKAISKRRSQRITSMKYYHDLEIFRCVAQYNHVPRTELFTAVSKRLSCYSVHCIGLLQTNGQYTKQQFYTIIVLPDDEKVKAETCRRQCLL